jgi:hypothetical protein
MEKETDMHQANENPESGAQEMSTEAAADLFATPPATPDSALPKIDAPSLAAAPEPAIVEPKMPPAAQLTPSHPRGAAAAQSPSAPASRGQSNAKPQPAQARPANAQQPAPSAAMRATAAAQQASASGPRTQARPVPFPRADAASRPASAKARPAADAARAALARLKDVPRQKRFALLAASVGIAAGLGAAVGAMAALGLAQPSGFAGGAAELRALQQTVAQLGAEVGAVKTSLEHSGKAANGQFARIVDRLERAERAQSDPATKLTKVLESLERLERRAGGSAAAAAANDTTGAIPSRPPAASPPKAPVLENWVLRRVYDGVALVQGRRGVVEVEPGDSLSGAGRIQEIKREDGRWVVVTSRGLIVSAR